MDSEHVKTLSSLVEVVAMVLLRGARGPLSQFYHGANSLRTADLQQCIWGDLGSTLCCRHSCGTLRDHWFGVLYDGHLHGKV